MRDRQERDAEYRRALGLKDRGPLPRIIGTISHAGARIKKSNVR